VKQVSKYGGDVTKFVPANVAAALRAAYGFGSLSDPASANPPKSDG
jgi:hypothetical protein